MAPAVTPQSPAATLRIALVGNPNTGKSTLFNALTGFRQRVGNYPGVTVEKKSGLLRGVGGRRIEVLDLPGTHTLAASSEDEAIVLDALLGQTQGEAAPDVILAVADATSLTRSLFLVEQILEIGRPVVVALNMMDLAEEAGLKIDTAALSEQIGAPFVPVVAKAGTGIHELRAALVRAVEQTPFRRCAEFPACVQREVEGLHNGLSAAHRTEHNGAASRLELLQALLDPGGYHERRLVQRRGPALERELEERRARLAAEGVSLAEVEAAVRYQRIEGVVARVVRRVRAPRTSRSQRVDRVFTHRLWGLLVLLVLLGACFQSIYAWAAPVMDAIDATINGGGSLVESLVPAGALRSLLVDGAIAGVGSVLVFLPQILILFLFLAILEDCGYIARAAFLLDRWMGLLGLNGKSFIPLLSSFACAVPGIMATRTIENRRDRFVTILIAPLMSCSARLPVYTLLIGAFVPATYLLGGVISLRAVVLLFMYFLGVIVAIGVAFVLQHTLLRGQPQSFLMELPPYKWPAPKTVLYRMYEQGREFCRSAGTIIFAVALVIWALGYFPHPRSIRIEHDAQREALRQAHAAEVSRLGSDAGARATIGEVATADARLAENLADVDHREAGTYLRSSLLGRLGAWIEPAVKPLGWDWRIGTAALASFPAREIVVATLATLYNLGDEQTETSAGLRDKLRAARWPDGRPVLNLAVALSIMVFFALCCQCGGTLATIKRETRSWRWPVLTFSYMTALAYVAALLTYQVAVRFV